MAAVFIELAEKVDAMEEYTIENIEKAMRDICEAKTWKTKELFMPVRVAVTGRKASPPLFESIHVIGRERTRRRLRMASEYLKTRPTPSAK